MDRSDPDSLLRRIRWPNVARLGALALLAVLAATVPHLDSRQPPLPSGAPVPVMPAEPATPPVVSKPAAPARPRPRPRPRKATHEPTRKRPRRSKHRESSIRRRSDARFNSHPVTHWSPPPPPDPATEFNPAQSEFGR